MSSSRILVVEDEHIVARDICLQLTMLGHEPVGHAASGEQAISMAESLRPDLVLMDVRLAGAMDGISAAEQIRIRLALPVVFLTAFGGDDTLQRAKQSNPFGYILKPFSETELHTVIEIALYRHQAETRLRESELRFRTIFEAEPECVKLVGPSGDLLEMNPAGLAMLEVDTLADAIAHGLINFVVPEHRATFAALHRRVMTGARGLLEFEVTGRLGTRRWLETHASALRDAAGRVTSLLGVTRDVTERRRAALALQSSEQRFRTLVEWTPEASVVHCDGRLVYANPSALHLFGAAGLTDLVGLPISTLIHPDSLQEQLQRVLFIDKSLAVVPMVEASLVRLDGSVFDAEVRGTSIDYDGAPSVYLAVRDITARKAAEAQLHKLSMAVEQSAQSILITNADGCIEYVNQGFERITGYSSADALGRDPSFLGSSSNPEQGIDGLWAALRRGQTWRGELINRRRDGSEYTALLLAVPLRQSDGSITNYLELHDDISDQKRLAAELDLHRNHLEQQVVSRTADLAVARRQADTANQAKSAFLANMSHEIRTPMNAIMGLSQLMRRAAPTPEQAERLDKIVAASQHMMDILNDVLDLSKIEAGRVELECTDFELTALLDQIASIVGDLARAKGLTFAVEGQGVPLWLHGDVLRLRQALLNYAGNAIKFTARGSVTLRALTLQHLRDDLLLRFEVQDSGPGVAPDQLARLFQDFEQGDSSVTRRHGGTGLGLAITRRLAHMMRGEAGAESTLGTGSIFWLTARLQLGKPTETARRGPGSDQSDADHSFPGTLQGARILLVEDNLVNRELALAWLTDLGLVVDTACDGLEAVEHARSQHYDLVLMDMHMPEMDGLEATRAIRKLPGWQNIPIIALTANALDESVRDCQAAGMNDLITKPVSVPALNSTLGRWLARSKI